MSTPWITVAKADLSGYMNAAQFTALQRTGATAGQADFVPAVIQDVCEMVRARCKHRMRISATLHTIPPELKSVACLLVLAEVQFRIPALAFTDDQRTRIKEARKDLDRVTEGTYPVSLPPDPIYEGQAPAGVAFLGAARRLVTPLSTRGM